MSDNDKQDLPVIVRSYLGNQLGPMSYQSNRNLERIVKAKTRLYEAETDLLHAVFRRQELIQRFHQDMELREQRHSLGIEQAQLDHELAKMRKLIEQQKLLKKLRRKKKRRKSLIQPASPVIPNIEQPPMATDSSAPQETEPVSERERIRNEIEEAALKQRLSFEALAQIVEERHKLQKQWAETYDDETARRMMEQLEDMEDAQNNQLGDQ